VLACAFGACAVQWCGGGTSSQSTVYFVKVLCVLCTLYFVLYAAVVMVVESVTKYTDSQGRNVSSQVTLGQQYTISAAGRNFSSYEATQQVVLDAIVEGGIHGGQLGGVHAAGG